MNGLIRDVLLCLATGAVATAALIVADRVHREPEPAPQLGIGLSSTNDHFEVKVRSGEHAASVIFRLNVREFTSVEVTNYADRTFAPVGWVPLPGVPGTWISTVGVLATERMEVVK